MNVVDTNERVIQIQSSYELEWLWDAVLQKTASCRKDEAAGTAILRQLAKLRKPEPDTELLALLRSLD